MPFKSLRWLWKTRVVGDSHRILMRKPLGKSLLGRIIRRRKPNVRIGLREIGFGFRSG
jgi:hypothetical protein